MIPIIIDNKKYKIKAIDELNTKEFIELTSLPELDTIHYIAWQTKTDLSRSFFATSTKAIDLAVGKIKDPLKLPIPKWVNTKLLIETVGQRHQIEESKLTGYPLIVFILAVSQARSNDIDKVNELRDKYMLMDWIEIIPAGIFFFKILNYGLIKEKNFFKRILILIKIQLLKFKQG